MNFLYNEENFKCQRKGINNTCSNIPFGIRCLNTKEIKNRKKRELIIWVNCGMWIAYGIILKEN
ncbi:hypothetical protein Mgra_00001421 [Meloidogyne graminicola]|uniref:Uncharacterized protein n=1 Tax=Meloidogyne graminicola TaxID=189291 RepID=A0A8S9ZZQ5_9BILA|nr:hypothetical protein Mgra_00001421 [Meloidogyne graminicola]